MLLLHRRDARTPRKRLPLQIPPVHLEVDYARGLLRILNPVIAAYKPLLERAPELLALEHRRMDAREGTRLRDAQRRARAAGERSISKKEIEALARKFAKQTATHQRVQLNKQVHAVLGADPVLADRGLARASEQFVEQNVELITTIPKRLHAEVETMVQSALESSRMSPKLSKHIEERFGVAQRHARLVARDQIGKHHGKLNRIRQQELDITSFVWRSVGDERVRDWHRDELDGNEYAWDELPLSERGEPIAPGDDFQCRCGAEPVI